MNLTRRGLVATGLACASVRAADGAAATPGPIGAAVPWTTYRAQDMQTNGVVLGPAYAPYRIETESTAQRCVRLVSGQDYVEFTARSAANAMVIRFSLPDAPGGGGTASSLRLYRNGAFVCDIAIASAYAWLYGAYPFTKTPGAGRPRRFFDEVRLTRVPFARGDVIRLRKADDAAAWCAIDLVDLEDVTPAPAAPANSLSVMDFGAGGRGDSDDTAAVRRCVDEAARRGMGVWAPPGTYRLTGEIRLTSGQTFRGAGVWHTRFVGDPAMYSQPDRRVRFVLNGRKIRLADFAIIGCLTYRNDDEANDGVIGVHASDGDISNIWVEHTKVGAWLYGCARMVIEGCRFRNTMADGVNLCTHTMDSVVRDCATRNTGDDGFAIWPAAFDHDPIRTPPAPGRNVIRHCTAQLAYLANGGAIYGGADNRIENCQFTDITAGCGVLISSTFPTADLARGIDYGFSGLTAVRDCRLARCGGFDHEWSWRAALQICVDQRDISGVGVSRVEIEASLSDGVSIVGPGDRTGPDARKPTNARPHTLSRARLDRVTVDRVGLGGSGRHGLWVQEDVGGGLSIAHSRMAGVANRSPTFSVVRD